MTNYDEFQLDLLVTSDLPIDERLNEADTVKLSQALSQILKALKQVDVSSALIIIEDELNKLDSTDVFPAKISSSKIALKSWEIEDFDSHFDVNHVESQQPAFCIAKSLLLAVYRMFALLNEQNNPEFDSLAVERQKQGYISYVRLLSRVYHLQLM